MVPLVDFFVDANSHMAGMHASNLFEAIGCADQILRIQDENLVGDVASNDLSTEKKLQDLVEVGEKLLEKEPSEEDFENGKIKPMLMDGKKVTNADILAYYAKLLSAERKLRVQNMKLDAKPAGTTTAYPCTPSN